MKTLIWTASAVAVAAAAGLHLTMGPAGDTSLLLAIIFWTAVTQGVIALCAAAELAEGDWIKPVKDSLLKIWPLLAMFPVAFLVYGLDLHHYKWHHHQTAWMEPRLFLWRNVAALALTFVAGASYANASMKKSPRTGVFAVVYLFFFVVTQSLVGMDWVMSFEYPFISTMLPALFFIESIFAGIALTVLFTAVLVMKGRTDKFATMKDAATLMFGFSLLWAGLFFAEYLTIWYANIPEEVAFFHKRVNDHFALGLMVYSFAGYFLLPFISLIPSRSRSSPAWLLVVVTSIFSALLVRKLFFLVPVSNVSFPLTTVHWLLLGAPVVLFAIAALKTELTAES